MRTPRLTVCLLPLLAAAARAAAPPSGQSDGWPRYAHDPALTARSPLHGKITKPQTRWSYSAAGRELLVEIVPAKGEQALHLVAKESVGITTDSKVTIPGPLALDLDGSGSL